MRKPQVAPKIERLLRRKAGILLNICMGGVPQPNAVVLSPQGDIKHDPRVLPFPLPDGVVHTAIVNHILEFLDPSQFFAWFDELHRIMRKGGVVYFEGPYGGDDSVAWISDPAHKTRVNERSFYWLDAASSMYQLHQDLGRPAPRPWRIQSMSRQPANLGVSYNVTLQTLNPLEVAR